MAGINVLNVVGKVLQILPSGKLPGMLSGLYMNATKGREDRVGFAWAFEKAVKKYPNNITVIYEDREYTYQEFNDWANQMAQAFLAKGLKHGDTICIMLENRPELLVASLALNKIGVIPALLNTSQTGEVLTHSINLVKPKYLLLGEECVVAVKEIISDFSSLTEKELLCFSDQDSQVSPGETTFTNFAIEVNAQTTDNPGLTHTVRGKDPVFNIYTSGTTGLPKAAVFTNGRWLQAYAAFGKVTLRLTEKDRMYIPLPFYHATAIVTGWAACIAQGASIIVQRKFSAKNFWIDVEHYQATCFNYVGELCRYLLNQPTSPTDAKNTITKIFGNGLRPAIWTEFKTRFGIKQVAEFYASSEGNVAFFNVFNFDKTVGFTIAPYALVKYDLETGQPTRGVDGYLEKVKDRDPGVLIGKITKKYPFDGYTEKDKTQKSILRDCFQEGDQWFNTGDLMKNLGFNHTQFVDRLGDTFRWKGENVSTTQVENAIQKMANVDESVVYGVEIPNTDGRAGMACVHTKEGTELDMKEFFAHVSSKLPHYAVPVFLRIRKVFETTGTFKYKKTNLKKEAFYSAKCGGEKIYVCLPKSDTYIELTPEIEKSLCNSEYKY